MLTVEYTTLYPEETNETRMKTVMAHLFIQFLANNDALDNWLTEVVAFHERRCSSLTRYNNPDDFNWVKEVHSRRFISSCLNYGRAAQGEEYWRILHVEWGRIRDHALNTINRQRRGSL